MKSGLKGSLEGIVSLGRNIRNSVKKHRKGLTRGVAALALPFMFANFTNKAEAEIGEGSASISFSIDGVGGASWCMAFINGASDGLDDYDQPYGGLPPSPEDPGYYVKATSEVEGVELIGDARPPPPSGGGASCSVVGSITVTSRAHCEATISGSAEGYVCIEDGTTIDLGYIEPGFYPDGFSVGSVSFSWESTTPPPPPPPPPREVSSPTVITNNATSIGKTSAMLEGILDNDGYNEGDESCDYRFSYWLEGQTALTTSWKGSIYEGDTFTNLISNLTPNTFYYFMAEARNSGGESSGATRSFITLPPGSTDPGLPAEFRKLVRLEHWEGGVSKIWRLALKETASNDLDESDQLYIPETGPKIISLISKGNELYELKLDARKTADEPILLEASSVSSSGQLKALAPNNRLQVYLDDPNISATLQPYDPNFPAQMAYNLAAIIQNNNGIIELSQGKTEALFILDLNSALSHWPLDESSGNKAEDKTGGGHDGTVYGNPSWRSEGGKVNGALLLDGVDDYISTPFILNPSGGDFSVYAWVKGSIPGRAIVCQQNGQAWLESSLDGKLATGLTDSSRTNLTSSETITNNEWHHVGFVWTGSKRQLYVDGKQAAKDAEKLNNLQGSQGGLYLGRNNTGEFWKGSLDDVIVYSIPVGDLPSKGTPEPQADNFEGFESGDFSKSKFKWNPNDYNTRTENKWTVSSDDSYSGSFCAKAVNNTKGANSYLSVTVNCKDGDISFWRKISSSYNWGLSFYINGRASEGGTELGYWGGEKDWEKFSYPVKAGARKFIWFYKQDYNIIDGEAAWIDSITFPLAE